MSFPFFLFLIVFSLFYFIFSFFYFIFSVQRLLAVVDNGFGSSSFGFIDIDMAIVMAVVLLY